MWKTKQKMNKIVCIYLNPIVITAHYVDNS